MTGAVVSGGIRCQPVDAGAGAGQHGAMPILVIILLIVGIVLLLLGVFVEAVKFLLWSASSSW